MRVFAAEVQRHRLLAGHYTMSERAVSVHGLLPALHAPACLPHTDSTQIVDMQEASMCFTDGDAVREVFVGELIMNGHRRCVPDVSQPRALRLTEGLSAQRVLCAAHGPHCSILLGKIS